MMTVDQIIQLCHSKYTYRKDNRNYGEERMDTHESAVLAGERWSDDCDGFAGTAATIAIMEGYPRERVKLIICKLKQNGEMHMVAGVDMEETTLIMDCNFKRVYDFNRSKEYEWLYFQNMDEPGQWYRYTD